MSQEDGDSVARGSFSFGVGHRMDRSENSNNNGGMAPDARTAAQLIKLQKLVESLVVRELERGDVGPSDAFYRPASSSRPQQRPAQPGRSAAHGSSIGATDSSAGVRSRKSAHRTYSIDTQPGSVESGRVYGVGTGADNHGLGDEAPGHGAAGRVYGGGAAGARTSPPSYPATRGSGSSGSSAVEEGLQMQVLALQNQLALLGEQLNAAYRSAEAAGAHAAAAPGTATPPAAASQPPHHHLALGASSGPPLGARSHLTYPFGLDPARQSPTAPHGIAAQAQPASPAMAASTGPPAAAASGPQGAGLGSADTSALGSGLGLSLGKGPGSGAGAGSASTGVAPSAVGTGISGSGAAPPASTSIWASRQPAGPGLGPGAGPSLTALEERVAREASAREDERLRGWIQELRSERRRLEDRLLGADPAGLGHAAGAQQTRDELEKQVMSLARQRDQLSLELEELGVTQTANAQLARQVDSLELALAAEVERVARYKEVRPVLEGQLAELSASLESLRRQHVAALEALSQERDTALLKAKRSAKRTAELEAAVASANDEVRRLQDEVRSQMVSLAEMRAGGEVLQAASQQMQANMEAQARDTAGRLAAIQSQLEASQSECVILRRQLEAAHEGTDTLRDQLKEAQARLEVVSSERSRLAGSLAAEQRNTAAVRQQLDAMSAQLRAGEEARADAARAAAAQLEAVRRQHATEMAATQKQYESQLSVAERQYLLLQRQYDAGLASNDVAAEAAATLRRERDALWAEAQNLKAELAEVRTERDDVASKLTSLRTEVRTTMEEVTKDRDAKLAATTVAHEVALRDLRHESEQRTSTVRRDYEAKLANLSEMAEKLRAEAQDAQRQADKYRTAAGHLKDQVRDLLLSRDAAERELASERAFNEELNRILTSLREEQLQSHQQHHQRLLQQRAALGHGLGAGLGLEAGQKLSSPRG